MRSVRITFLSEVGADPGRLRIGVCTASAINPAPHLQAKEAVDAAARTLEELGHRVEILDERPFDDLALAREFLSTWFVYLAWEVDDAKRRTGCSDRDFEIDTRIIAALGRAHSSVEYVDTVMRRHEQVRRLSTYFEGYDLLMTPTLADLPPRIGALDTPRLVSLAAAGLLKTRSAGLLRHSALVETMIDDNLSWIPYTQLANLTGRPALTLLLHWTPEGVPMGVQFTAQLGGESMLVRLAGRSRRRRRGITADRRHHRKTGGGLGPPRKRHCGDSSTWLGPKGRRTGDDPNERR